MISPVSNATQVQAAVQPKAPQAPAQQAPPPVSQAPSDTVKISSASQQILQESRENSVQTAKEAAGGDAQARRLLAREAADNAPVK